jgi:acetolactate synthase-1/2/3 large subunit
MVKVSDYIVHFIEERAEAAFLLPGGAIMHVIDSLGASEKLRAIVCHHEQGVATAAEGYGRMKNSPGFIAVTSGPGGTNAITGVAGAWLDSIPMFVMSGQVKTDNITPRKNGMPAVRTMGFQELNIVDLVRPITKYAVMVEDAKDIRYHLEKAWHLATTGRPGPVWLDIPLDITATLVDPEALRGFTPTPSSMFQSPKLPLGLVTEKLRQARRPLLMAGNGIRLAGAEDLLWRFLERTGINTVTPMFTADDLVTYEYPNYLGRQGMWGNDSANYAVDNCDLLLIVGERLQLTQTSYDYEKFATQATKIMVDVDPEELHKKTVQIDIPIECDARCFLAALLEQDLNLQEWHVQPSRIDPADFPGSDEYVDVYRFLEELNGHTHGWHVATADGTASLMPHRTLRVTRGQRFLTNAALGQTGSGLPLAIGCAVASGTPVICMEGDGSLMFNIQELQTAVYNKLPIKLFIYNNNGYVSVRNTHRNYFGRLFASDPESGISFPDYSKVIPAFGIPYTRISNNGELHKVAEFMSTPELAACEIMIDPGRKLVNVWAAGKFRES